MCAIYYTTRYFLLPNIYFETSSIESTIHITTGEKDDNTIYMNVIVCQKTKSKRRRKDMQYIHNIHECTLLFVKICVSKTLFCQKRKIREMHFPLQATLHVGDEIREINGISVANQVYDEKKSPYQCIIMCHYIFTMSQLCIYRVVEWR